LLSQRNYIKEHIIMSTTQAINAEIEDLSKDAKSNLTKLASWIMIVMSLS
jgi:hypothetical protein